jgi:hypothetical protein
VPRRMLAEGNVAGDDGRLQLRELGCAEILFAKQAIDRASADAGKERSLGIHPCIVNICGLLFDGAARSLESPGGIILTLPSGFRSGPLPVLRKIGRGATSATNS